VLGIAYGLAIWVCLLIVLIVSPEGQVMLFPLTAVTLLLSWIGHAVFGAVLGAMLGRTGMRPNRMPGYATGESPRKNATQVGALLASQSGGEDRRPGASPCGRRCSPYPQR
jgi:hypothetical protein